jgi:hypothetical protein
MQRSGYYYPVLYYNAEIWLTPFLHTSPRQQLLSASENAIRMCLNYPNPYISFLTLHSNFKKSTLDQISRYKISLLLYKTFNNLNFDSNWVDLNIQIISTSIHSTFNIHNSANFRIENNILSNKFTCIANKIKLDLLNLPYPTYKYKMRQLLLLYEANVFTN